MMPKSKDSASSSKIPARVHDKFFKDVFRVAEYVTSLIQVGAPKALFKIIDWSTLSAEPQLIQAGRQEERIADLVFSVALKDGENAVRIVLLFEHKSYRDSALERQMARNQFLMYLQSDFQSLIVPIVVLQDPTVECRPVVFSNLFQNVSEQSRRILAEYSINFRCLVINVNEIDRQGLAEKTNIDVVIRTMSKVRELDAHDLQDLVDRIKHVPVEDRERILILVLGYVCDYNGTITPDDILNLKTKSSEEQQMVLSAVEAFREEGRAKGLEQGLEQGCKRVATNLLRKGMGLEEVVEVTKLSTEQVETLQREINGTSDR